RQRPPRARHRRRRHRHPHDGARERDRPRASRARGCCVTIAVVPFKDLDAAKERLASRLDQGQRRALVLAMLDDVLGALSRVHGLSGLLAVTREPEIARRAARFGAEILEEPANEGHTAAVLRAIRELERRGASAMLCVSGDLPAAASAEFDAMLGALGPAPSVVL